MIASVRYEAAYTVKHQRSPIAVFPGCALLIQRYAASDEQEVDKNIDEGADSRLAFRLNPCWLT